MKKYELMHLKIIVFVVNDVIATSIDENVDDFGGWNSDWF